MKKEISQGTYRMNAHIVIPFALSLLASCWCLKKLARENGLSKISKFGWSIFSFFPVIGPLFFYLAFNTPAHNRESMIRHSSTSPRGSFGTNVPMPTYEEMEQEYEMKKLRDKTEKETAPNA